jgi:hypothetical protein
MKVNYVNTVNTTTLNNVEVGGLFRPINSLELFIKTVEDASGDLFNECESRLMDYFENPQSDDWEHYYELMLCVNVTNGEVVLFHRDLEVVELKASIEVEE